MRWVFITFFSLFFTQSSVAQDTPTMGVWTAQLMTLDLNAEKPAGLDGCSRAAAVQPIRSHRTAWNWLEHRKGSLGVGWIWMDPHLGRQYASQRTSNLATGDRKDGHQISQSNGTHPT